MKSNLFLPFLLIFSLLFFLIKGINYAIIGSWLPLYVALFFSTLIGLGYFYSMKLFRWAIFFWAIFLTIWSFILMAMEVALQFSPKVTESHVRDQFTILFNLLIVLFFTTGISIFRTLRKSRKIKGNPFFSNN